LSTKSSSSRMNAPAQSEICAIFPGALGDFTCFLPTLEALRQRGLIDLYASSELIDLVPEGVTLRSLESPEISELFRLEPASTDGRHRFRQYDAVYSWHGSANPEFVQRLRAITTGRARCFAFRPDRVHGHQADYYLSCVGHGPAHSPPAISIRLEAAEWRKSFWAKHALEGVPLLAIAPGSGAREKNWPAEFFLAIVEWWRKATGGQVLLLIGPVEQERGGLDELRRRCVVADRLSLAQIGAALAETVVYLGNDSGISHLAGAVGVRTVVLFGPSDHLQWAPRGDKVLVLRRNLACSPCDETTMKACPHRACLHEFPVRKVIGAIARLPEVVTLTR
jgi:ADP-heptose:LPS heptosyltransferase